MRKPSALLFAALLTAVFAAPVAHASVILSELCDPQQFYTTDRFIEIYNTGPGTVDLTGWSVQAIANGDTVVTWTLSGTLDPAQAKVCGSTTATTFTVHFQSAVWATSAGYMNWNGKIGDGANLRDHGVVVDKVLATGVLFENADLVRKANVTVPSATFEPSEWTSTHVELATDASPGTHNGSQPPASGPAITNIVTIPASPPASTPVDVQATVVDTAGSIASVTLSWGPTSSSLSNAIAMGVVSGDTYQTTSQIPGQTAGVIVYYQIEAVGAVETSQSTIRSYTIPGTSGAPAILAVGEMSDSTFLVTFSEPVEETSAEIASYYTVGALSGVTAERDPSQPSQVLVKIPNIAAGPRTMAVTGVADLDGNATSGATRNFTYVDVTIPAGYYDTVTGLYGQDLRAALHNLIDNHTVKSYDYAFTAFETSDVKPNGKVWDVYSDIPGGTPPYEYDFIVDQGQGANEGMGFNREHSWPQSWFNEASPMRSDLYMLYPTDAKVNGYRANYPFGEVDSPTITSLNGSKVGPNVTQGYDGIVFEPIDAYKGDLARSAFYVGTRYFGEDAGWDGSPSTDGAEILPWAVDLFLQWTTNDPVSWKERLRNGAIYLMQNNRNPFVDHPEFVALIYDPNAVGVGATPGTTLRLRQSVPNPFGNRTTIGFDLARSERATVRLFDVTGRRVRTLVDGNLGSGSHAYEWNGRDDAGALLEAGLYFCRLEAGPARATRRVVFTR